jgi:hypothetical protein
VKAFFPPRIGGEQLMVTVAEHCEAWRRVWSSSWKPFDHARGVSLSCDASRQRGDGRRGALCSALTRWGVEGAAEGCFKPVKGHTTFEGGCPCLLKVLQRRRYKE